MKYIKINHILIYIHIKFVEGVILTQNLEAREGAGSAVDWKCLGPFKVAAAKGFP